LQNPLGLNVPVWLLDQLRLAALIVIMLGYVTGVASLVDRFRNADGDARLQLKWFAYSGVVMVVALVYGVTAQVVTQGLSPLIEGRHLGDALIPLGFATLTVPVTIGVAILRYRLYDIDLIINRSLVYGGLTAILGAVYAAVITLL